jgi:hypothetical protein
MKSAHCFYSSTPLTACASAWLSTSLPFFAVAVSFSTNHADFIRGKVILAETKMESVKQHEEYQRQRRHADFADSNNGKLQRIYEESTPHHTHKLSKVLEHELCGSGHTPRNLDGTPRNGCSTSRSQQQSNAFSAF